MEGLAASVVVIAIVLGVLVLVAFDAFCLVRLGTSGTPHVVPRFAWAVLIVGCSPAGGVAYLLAQRLRTRSPEPVTMRPRPPRSGYGWHGPWLAEYRPAPASPMGHAVTVVAIAGAVLLAQAGELLVAAGILICLVVIAFLRNTPPG